MLGVASTMALAVIGLVNIYDVDQVELQQIVSIACEHRGRFAKGCAWELKVDREGRAMLTTRQAGKEVLRQLSAKGRLLAVAKEVNDQRFFDLPSEIGTYVPDGNTRRLTIKTSQKEKTVTIRYLSRSSLDETAARALRVWKAVRGTFDDNEAFDSRPFDRELLKAQNK
jgi:hypothetical protein